MRTYIITLIVLVSAAIIAGFFMVGSPSALRFQKIDDQRIADLQMLQSQITNYWQAKNKLPTSLADLNDSLRGITVPQDPQTKTDYVYEMKSAQVFDLCATFSAVQDKTNPSQNYYAPYGISGNTDWFHPAGYYCFERTIDPAFFKNTPVPPLPL